jgi:hypothetical protein
MLKISTLFFLLLPSLQSFAVSNSDRQEIPDDITNNDIDPLFIDRVKTMLPERGHINQAFLDSSEEAVFDIKQNTEIYSTFLWEGAGYKNSFGYALLNQQNEIIHEEEVVGNTSMIGSGGKLRSGDTFKVGDFSAGDRVTFYIWGNGWNRQNNTKQKYYTLDALNQDDIKHVVTAYDSIEEKVVIGFEDLWRGGDKDYNDLIFTIFSTPISEIDSDAGQRLLDTSGRQCLNSSYGNVSMTVARYGEITELNDVNLYPKYYERNKTLFTGIEEFNIESNSGVVLTISLSSITNGNVEYPLYYHLDGNQHTLMTEASTVHKSRHIIKIFTDEILKSEVEAGDWFGSVTLTLSSY